MSDAVNAIADLQKEITGLDINKLFDVTKAFGDVNTGIDMSKMLEIVSAVKEKTGQGAQDILDAFRADDETQKLDYTWLLGNLETEVLAKFGTSKEAIRTTLFQIDDNLGNSLDFGAIASQLLAVKDTDAMIIAISAVQRKIAEVSNAGYDFAGIVESLQKLIDEGKLTSPINSIISAIEAVNTAGTGLTFQGFVSALKALSVSVNEPIGDVFDMLAGISKAPDGTDYSLYKTKLDEVAVGFKTTAGEIETAAKGIASAVVGPSGATKVVVEFAGLEEADKKAANDTLLFVSGLVDTANDLGVALSDVLGAVKDSFSEAGTITGAADSAASKMENTQKQRVFFLLLQQQFPR
ncbi:hypothetical protein EOM81_11325 [bacterium]|nr:hypothetical protein [bacterium]